MATGGYNILGPEYKIILLGEPGVGKTSYFFRVRENVFLADSPTTVCTGIEHLEHSITINGQEVKVTSFLKCIHYSYLINL